jgi:hypothetical protein
MDEIIEFGVGPKHLPTGSLLAAAHAIYRRHFSFFMKIFIPAAALSYVVYQITQVQANILFATLPGDVRGNFHRKEFYEGSAFRWSGVYFSWMLYCFVFSGVVSATRGIQKGQITGADESLQGARGRPLAFLALSSVLYVLFLICAGVTTFATSLLSWSLWSGSWFASILALTFSLICGAAVFSRWALAIPSLVEEGVGPLRSLHRSASICGYVEVSVIWLIAEATVANMIAAFGPTYAFNWFATRIALPAWSVWVPFSVSSAMMLVIEPLLFIGLSVAYFRAREREALEQQILANAGLPTELR